MRTLLGPPAEALGRRGLALERAALITLRRDAYADPPGTTLGLAIGERTTYRPGAWLLDTFERNALGDPYAAWGGAAGLTLGAGGVTAAVGPVGMVTHPRVLPRDAWAALTIGALGGDAEVGLLLRAAADTPDGYWITATPTQTLVERLDAGVATSLASVATPWRAGEMLRAVWVWDQLRVYRDTILVAQVTEATRLVAGHAGFTARRGDAGAQAALTAFLGGASRQEWLGAGLDLGDVQRHLGQPAAFDVMLSNLAPMGGADRFAALLRHGVNTLGTYDLDRGEVRVLTVIDGLSPPLTVGLGLIDGPAEVTEDRVRLACRGRDAFLTPRLAPGVVTYLPGPPPGGLTPLPPDPCAPSDPPVIDAGPQPPEPPEPPDPPPTNPPREEGAGPEAPPVGQPEGDGAGGDDGLGVGGGGGGGALLGEWLIAMEYASGDPEDVYGTPVLLPTTVTAAADWTSGPVTLRVQVAKLGGTEAEPHHKLLWWLYRGPDVVGTHLVAADPGADRIQVFINVNGYSGVLPTALTFTVHQYVATGISTTADLAALHPPVPDTVLGDLPGTLPASIETLATWSFASDGNPWGSVLGPVAPVVLNRFTGPQLLGLEVAAGHFAGWDGVLTFYPYGVGTPTPPSADLGFGAA